MYTSTYSVTVSWRWAQRRQARGRRGARPSEGCEEQEFPMLRNGRPSQLLLISSNGLGRKEVCARLWRRNNRSQVGLDVHWDLVSSKAVRPSWQSPKKVKAGER